jgi:hypothetical protein
VARERGQLIVWQSARATAVLADREIELGPVREGQVIVTIERPGAAPEVRVMDGADPAIAGLARPS